MHKAKLREKVFQELADLKYQVVECRKLLGDVDWKCILVAAQGERYGLHGVRLTVRTPSPLEFDRLYAWELLCFCPLWVSLYTEEKEYRFSANTTRTPHRRFN